MIITVSLLVTRIGAVALSLTGLSPDVARFQARSAFTGVGFTTSESEQLVNHPVRRRILMLLMFWGNIGIAAVIASTIVSLTSASILYSSLVLAVGVAILWIVFTSRFVDDIVSKWVESALRRFTNLDVRDYNSLLHLQSGYVVVQLSVHIDDWISGMTLQEANLSSEGVLVLGLTRQDDQYVGSPNGNTRIEAGDVLTLYGPEDRLEELDLRKKGYEGDRAHRIAIQVQQESVAEE